MQTGIYNPSSDGYNYDGEYDYEPAYLSKVKTHVFYPVGLPCHEYFLEIDNIFDCNWIERSNLEVIE